MRPRLTYANVVATLALFIALGGASYAALKLPKNSVGSKQIKKNAVTTAKIKNEAITAAKVKKRSLTGTQINTSRLGSVPNADHANSADIAAEAGNAATLGGSSGSDFAKSNRFLFGHAKVSSATPETLLSAPGDFLIRTNGLGKFEPNIVIEGLSPDRWDFISMEHENAWGSSGLKAGDHSEIGVGTAVAGIIYAVNAEHPAQQALIDCTYEFNTSELLCTAALSPAA